MNKASSALLATAGVTAGLLGFALPAGAAVSADPGPAPAVTKTFPSGGGQDGWGGGQDGWGGDQNGKSGGQDGKGGDNRGKGGDKPTPYPTQTKSPCPTRTRNPCPPKTKTPCPPKPCQPVVSKPCKPDKDKYGHLTSYRQAPKHVLVCKPKPCPTKPKPCPPKCRKHQPHKHTHPQQHAGIN
jgi:hypothetical protein